MDAGREVAVAVVAQWLRCDHSGTALDVAAGTVSLTPLAPAPAPGAGALLSPAGLAVGPDRRGYHAVPEAGRVDRVPWRPGTRQLAVAAEPLLAPPPAAAAGGFLPAGDRTPGRIAAVALTVSRQGLLAVVDGSDGAVLVIDLTDGRLMRRAVLPTRALDLAPAGDDLVVCVDDPDRPVWRLPWRAAAEPAGGGRPPGAPAGSRPARLATAPDGTVWVLWLAPDGTGVVTAAAAGPVLPPVAGASDLEVDGGGTVVVAGPPGGDLACFVAAADGVGTARPLRAPAYDGRGLARTPDGRIAYWGGRLRSAYPAPVRYATAGRVVTFALDSGSYGQRWGRIFLDACLPAGTTLRLASITSDELPDSATPDPAAGLPAGVDPAAAAALPPGPPLPATVTVDRAGPAVPVVRRAVTAGADGPWTRGEPGERLATYESMVDAAPGRYLWLVLTLGGTGRLTPGVRAVRVERSSPGLLDRLPQVYGEEPRVAAFLDRYLTLLAGPLIDADRAAADRHVLLDPAATPPELLPWLASLVGLTLDDRWPESARRRLLARAVPLFRARGTLAALAEMVQILVGVPPVVVERYRFRGLEDTTRVAATFDQYAHRFSVVLRGELAPDRAAALGHLLDEHRPAHTLVEVCTPGSARLGLGLHLELTSVVGGSDGFDQLSVGGVVGRGGVLGQPRGGITVGGGRLGLDARVEP